MNDTQAIRVMFVDDDPLILSGLRRQCRRMRPSWQVWFAESGQEALSLLAKAPVDIVVSDMRMPGMNGAEVLEVVRQRWPSMHRVILSGQTDQSSLLEHVGVIHRFLQKPCDMGQIVQAIEQSLKLRLELKASRLGAYVSRIKSLPVMTSVYRELMIAIESDESSVDIISKIVAKDMGLSVKVLQLVNSAFYCLPKRVESVTDAVHRIGLSNLKSLALIAKLFETLESGDRRNSHIAHLWSASTDIGAKAEMYAKAHNQQASTCADARLAGMLSMIGRVIMIACLPDVMAYTVELSNSTDTSLAECERKAFGVPQHVVGAYSLGIWAFADSITDAVLHQHKPSSITTLDLTHPAVYVHAARVSMKTTTLVDRISCDTAALARVGFNDSLTERLEKAA